MISISIAGREECDRKVIADLLAGHDDFHIASIGKDGYDALRSAQMYRPDIIITDSDMSDINSVELAPIIKRHSPSTKLIALYSQAEDGALGKALRAGISGYLLKQEDFDNLTSSVRSVFYGGLYVSDSVKCNVPIFFNGPSPDHNIIDRQCFSPTELQIFYGIALGKKDEEIAKQLNISIGTLRNSVRRVKQKTGLKNRTQIIIYALFNEMLNSDKIWEQIKNREPER